MSQLIQTTRENVAWLGLANKYLENQYEIKDSWGTGQIHKKESYDEDFMKEFDIITQIIKQNKD
jgi:outer membrane protease|tara:strand:- start:6741 stop:6932 length:192 start_codon:yes stop_codon:yes gene_type:complete